MNPTPLRDRLSALLVAFVREARAAPADLAPLLLRDHLGGVVVEVRVRRHASPAPCLPDDAEQTIVELLATHGPLRTCQIVQALTAEGVCAVATVKRRLAEMARGNVITRLPGRLGGWRLPLAVHAEKVHPA